MVQIAYCVLAHHNPELVGRLLAKLWTDEDSFRVTVFTSGGAIQAPPWADALRGFVDRGLEIAYYGRPAWGTFDLVDATLDAMRSARRRRYEYFVNLSGQCYPIRTVSEIKTTLGESGRTFMEARRYPDEEPIVTKMSRFEHRHYLLPYPIRSMLLRMPLFRKYIVSYPGYNYFLRLPRRHKGLPGAMIPFGGSQWFCMKREHVDYILDTIAVQHELVRFFRHVHIPDESFFQTVLLNSPFQSEIVNDNLRYIDWSTGNVKVLTMNDLATVLASSALWARKFDPTVDAQVLDEIDKVIGDCRSR